MALLNENPPLNSDDEEQIATESLGEPDAIYRIGRRAKIKAIVGISLVVIGLIINYVWWFHRPIRFSIHELHFRIWPLAIGIGLLWFVYRNRGLRVMLFPTGILRLKAGETESVPWEAIQTLRIHSDHNTPDYRWGENRQLIECWITPMVPLIQVWNCWLEIDREGATPLRFTPAVENFPELATKIQQVVFAKRWPALFEELSQGKSVEFGDISISTRGLTQNERFLAWSELQEMKILGRNLTIKKQGSWRTWLAKEIPAIPNFHLFLGLIAVLGDYEVKAEDEATPVRKSQKDRANE